MTGSVENLSPEALKVCRVLCRSGRFETGQGTCAMICMEFLGDPRKRGCGHAPRVFGKLATDIVDALSNQERQ